VLKPLQRNEAWVDSEGKPTNRFAQVVEDIIREIDEMATNIKLFRERPSATTPTNVYTAPASNKGGRGSVIKQFIATDPSGAATFNVYIGTTAGATTKVCTGITATAAGVSVAALIDALISPGDSVFVEVSAGNTIVFYCSGIERK
jgi:hypothetical protein